MKKVLFLLLILVGLLSVESCKKDQIQTAPDNGIEIENDSSLDVENRSYQEDACGNISKLCPTCEVGTAVTTKDLQPYVAGQSGSNEAKAYGIDKNILTIVVGTEEWVIHPAEFFKYESTELLIKHLGSQLLYSDTDLKIKKEANTVEIPIAVEMVKDLDQAAFKAGTLTASAIKDVLGQDVIVTNEGNGNYRVIVNNTNTTTVTSERIWRDPCQGKSFTNTVEKVYNDVLGKNVTDLWSADIVNAALEKYLDDYEIIHSEKFDFKTDCVNTQQVVNYMLENDLVSVSLSDAPHIKLNYLGALLQLSDEEYDWFYANGLNTHFAEINKLYNQLSVDSPFFPSCTDCGRVMAEQALVGLFMDGTLTASNSTEITEIDNFFIELECFDSDLYSFLKGKSITAKSVLAETKLDGKDYLFISNLITDVRALYYELHFNNSMLALLLEHPNLTDNFIAIPDGLQGVAKYAAYFDAFKNANINPISGDAFPTSTTNSGSHLVNPQPFTPNHVWEVFDAYKQDLLDSYSSPDCKNKINSYFPARVIGPAFEEAALLSLGVSSNSAALPGYGAIPDGLTEHTVVGPNLWDYHSYYNIIEMKARVNTSPFYKFGYDGKPQQVQQYKDYIDFSKETWLNDRTMLGGVYLIITDVPIKQSVIDKATAQNVSLYVSKVENDVNNKEDIVVGEVQWLNKGQIDISAHTVSFLGDDFLWYVVKSLFEDNYYDYKVATLDIQKYVDLFVTSHLSNCN